MTDTAAIIQPSTPRPSRSLRRPPEEQNTRIPTTPPTTTGPTDPPFYDTSLDRDSPTELLHDSATSTSQDTLIASTPYTTSSQNGSQSIAGFARDRTSAALANISSIPSTATSSLRSRSSSDSLVKQVASRSGAVVGEGNLTPGACKEYSLGTQQHPSSEFPTVRYSAQAPQFGLRRSPTLETQNTDLRERSHHHIIKGPPSPPRASPASSPAPRLSHQQSHNKMHQTSSRLLRMTDEDRPFTRDFKDLFATLMVSLPLSPHRVRFQRVEHTFSSEEAINNLGSLKFSQSNRMPDPKDPSRIVTTTTTTTFSMAKEMARSVCQRFMDARFIESADGKPITSFPLKNAVWQLTPKGIYVLSDFCQRNGINQKHILEVLDSPRNTMQLVILERDLGTDKLSNDRATIEVIFRRFVGQDGPNIKTSISSSDSDSLSDYYNGLIGVKMARERKIFDRVVLNTFTGKAAVDWLMDCCTTVDRRETYRVAELFVKLGLIWAVVEDKVYIHQNQQASFQPTKGAIYGLTDKGQRVAGWVARESSPANGEVSGSRSTKGDVRTSGTTRDSNTNRLSVILSDPALRLLFREYLRETHCEENLSFYLDVVEFTTSYRNATRKNITPKIDTVRETLAAAYGLYNAFLAPGSPCELNIDHNLRNNLASRMTRAVGDDDSMVKSLDEVARLFDQAQTSVFKLMSSDSVPKFLKDPKYASILHEHDFDSGIASNSYNTMALPSRTNSRLDR
ncbi:MAG: hypothetical protein M1827_003950 [Pycnora praestabilis]|nr:MAG: hypothetical protein M1827_003950 [Pycnora praestabilis]